VESAMAALVAPGAPVSVLIEYGLGDKLADMLLESGVSTVEKLGSMTPEDLEAIQGIGPKMVEKIQQAVNAYYGQFEAGAETGAEPGAETVVALEAEEGVEAAPASEVATENEVAIETEVPSENEAPVDAEALETAGESVETPDSASAESDSAAVESDRMKEIHASAQSPDDKGEVHES
jgi:transcription termination/antitermination protein NusA